jgi:tetratricopeptide (TPR) repeat protein
VPTVHEPDELTRGLALHQQGRLADAESVYLEILRRQPTCFDAWHLLGVIALQTRALERAVKLIGHAIKLNPDHPEAYNNLGTALAQLGHPDQALSSFDRAIALRPDAAEAFNNRGGTLRDLGRPEESLASYDRAIALQPDYVEPRYNRAILLADLGRPDAALLGLNETISLRPDHAEAHNGRGAALARMGSTAVALSAYDTAIALKPDYAEAHTNRGVALARLGRLEEALSSFGHAIALNPRVAEAYNGRGGVLAQLERSADALADFDSSIALKPDHAEVFNNRAAALMALGFPASALSSYHRAIELKPDYVEAHCNLAMCHLSMGDYEAGWRLYEWRLRPAGQNMGWARPYAHQDTADPETNFPPAPSSSGSTGGPVAAPRAGHINRLRTCDGRPIEPEDDGGRRLLGFDPHPRSVESHYAPADREANRSPDRRYRCGGPSIENKTILVRAEQGFGDTLQFCRYVPMLAATVVLEVPRPLTRLLSSLGGVHQIVATGDELPPFDAWIPMMSLPLAFRTTIDTIPAAVPYLHADPERSAAWRHRLATLPGRKIGLVWAGSPRREDPNTSATDRRRSITLDHYSPLAALSGHSLISLQKGEPAGQTRTPPPGMTLHDWTAELEDFADTAALVEALDLVISVDTSVVHLAGALGKPVWVLNRYDQCWRWLLNRTDSPWYPAARLFRQPSPGDWSGVMRDVVQALRAER